MRRLDERKMSFLRLPIGQKNKKTIRMDGGETVSCILLWP